MKNNRIIILTEKEWHLNMFENLKSKLNNFDWILMNNKDEFHYNNIKEINPKYIFIPHWSYIISDVIFLEFECIVFHMTDLPYGRGGSPLQNLIVLGKEKTKISALKVDKGIDTGDIYLKKDLHLYGTAQEIFLRSVNVIQEMIETIILEKLKPKAQVGESFEFKRRKPNESNIENVDSLEELYDFIRMLDADGYPHAFIETQTFKFEFSRATIKSHNEIIADVRIIKK